MGQVGEIRIEDRVAIGELLARYALHLDQGDMDRWLPIFDAEAVMEVPGQPPVSTREALVAFARSAPKGLHLVATPVLTPGADPDRVTAEQSYLFRGDFDGGLVAGWYVDDLVKRDGRWYLARRAVHYARKSRQRIQG